MQPVDFSRDVGGDGVIESTVEQEDYFGAFLIFVSTKHLPTHEATGHRFSLRLVRPHAFLILLDWLLAAAHRQCG
jgi:hypothetical protein